MESREKTGESPGLKTLFLLYGTLNSDGTAGIYLKRAYSLGEAMADMERSPGVTGGPYLVRDAFVEKDKAGGTLHVAVASVPEMMAGDA
jgi:hypothetical protein